MKAFEMSILPDLNLIPATCAAVKVFAKNFFDEKDVRRVGLATEEAINNVLKYSMSNTLEKIDISVEAENGDFTVKITDGGLPGNYMETLEGEDAIGMNLMQGMMDVTSVENLGTGGRCQKLVKYYTKMPEFAVMEKEEDNTPVEGAVITVRQPREDEMLEICRRLYGEYGLTYSHDDIYYPDKFWEEVKTDQIHSIVAVDQNDKIAGHHASFNWTDIPGIWESGMAVVDSRYRGAGIFGKMMDVTRDYVINQQKAKVFISTATTFHTATQKLRLKIGDVPCGYFLSSSGAELMHGTFQEVATRSSFAMACSILDKSEKTIYCPEEIVHVLKTVYEAQETPRNYVFDDMIPEEEETLTASFNNKRNKNGRIVFYRIGKDFERVLRTECYNMKRTNAEQIELAISMDGPGTVGIYNLAKKMGFFFEGFFPCADCGDVMFMVKAVSEPVNYEAIQTISPFTEMLEMIRAFDPDQK